MSIERFLVAVESIAASLAVIAGGAGTVTTTTTKVAEAAAPSETKETKPRAARTTKAAEAPAPAAEPAKTEAPAEVAKAAEPTFDYEELKKAIIALASAGEPGKEAALRILTDAGLNRGQKAADAPAAKWPGMHTQAVAALAAINAGGEFA